jgi:hypothetical protein
MMIFRKAITAHNRGDLRLPRVWHAPLWFRLEAVQRKVP